MAKNENTKPKTETPKPENAKPKTTTKPTAAATASDKMYVSTIKTVAKFTLYV